MVLLMMLILSVSFYVVSARLSTGSGLRVETLVAGAFVLFVLPSCSCCADAMCRESSARQLVLLMDGVIVSFFL